MAVSFGDDQGRFLAKFLAVVATQYIRFALQQKSCRRMQSIRFQHGSFPER
jgi:hypothetical protein